MQITDICDAVMRLYSYADATKMVHYSTTGNHYHELCDQIRDTILDFVDKFAEESFGYYGKPKYSDFKLRTDIKATESLDELCKNVLDMIASFRTEFDKDEKTSGLVSLIDDFKGDMNKLIFLSTFDKVSSYK